MTASQYFLSLPSRGIFGLLACALWCFLALSPVQAQHKRALLIGVHKYQHGTDSVFSDLNTESDVAAVRQVLIDRFGFAARDIQTLTTAPETTRASILKAMQDFLVTPTAPGDIVYFHYSGHGSQVPDPKDPSGVDETLVPSDWTQDGAKDIRDKELRQIIAQIQAKKPGSLTLTFDSCHSGTITRGGRMLVRGVSFEKRYGHPAPTFPISPAVEKTRGGRMLVRGGAFGGLLPGQGQDGAKSRYVVISACRDDQSAVETEDENHVPMGRLTFLLCSALRDAGPQTTYQDLFERIDSLMRQNYSDTRQDPQIEGDSSQTLLGSAAVAIPSYLRVENEPDGSLRLAAGSLQGMTKGSVLALYLAGTKDFSPKNSVATAQIVSTRLLTSKLTVSNQIKPDIDLTAARAVETSHQYGDSRLKVATNGLEGQPALLAALRTNDAITLTASADLPDVTLSHTGADLVLTREDGGALVSRFSPGPELAAQVAAALKRETQWRFVRALNNEDANSPVRIEMRIVPAEVTGNDAEGLTFVKDKPLTRGPVTINSDQVVTVEVRNIGTEDSYVSVLDVQSDASVQQLWPTPNQTASESLIPHGQPDRWQKLMQDPSHPMLLQFGGSQGAESFKAIATREKVDFKTLTTRDKLSPLERMLRAASAGTRASVAVTPSLWSTATVSFTVTP